MFDVNQLNLSASLSREKDLVILLGSFLVHKCFDYLVELIEYIGSYSCEDLQHIFSQVFQSITTTEQKWFKAFLEIISDRDFVCSFLEDVPAYVELITEDFFAVKSIDEELINSFVEFCV